MASLIESNLEFAEVLNAFPYIKTKLEKSQFDLRDVRDGVSIHDYFENKSYSEDEIDIFVKKLNFDVKRYLSNAGEKEFKLQKEKDVLIPIMDFSEGEEEEE